jgi:hypothetical protein
MTQHPIFTLPPSELRGYARGLRETAALLTGTGMGLHESVSLLVIATREAWEREAELVEGFAARLDAVEVALTEAQREQHGDFHFSPEAMAEIEAMLPPNAEETKDRLIDAGIRAAARQARADFLTEHLRTLSAEAAQAGLAEAVAESLAEQATPSEPNLEPKPSPIWTEERLALLRRLWPTTMHLDAIHAALNALPGEPISSPGGVKVKASKLELHRRGDAIPPEYAGAAESRTARRSAPRRHRHPPPTTPPAAPIKPTPAMLPEDKAEAREKLRTGEFKGAKAIMEEYGCTQDEAQALVDEHRNRMGKAA